MAHFPAAFVPHGGGPLPLLGAANHKGLVAFMKQLPSHLPRPKSIVLVSAHWEVSRGRSRHDFVPTYVWYIVHAAQAKCLQLHSALRETGMLYYEQLSMQAGLHASMSWRHGTLMGSVLVV